MTEPITSKTQETDTVKLHVHFNGFVELLIKHNAMFDSDAIIESKNFITHTLEGKKAFILVVAEGEFYTTKEARELASSDAHSSHHGAIAFASQKLAYKLLGSLYIKINKPKAPTRFFTKRDEAEKWLMEQIKNQ